MSSNKKTLNRDDPSFNVSSEFRLIGNRYLNRKSYSKLKRKKIPFSANYSKQITWRLKKKGLASIKEIQQEISLEKPRLIQDSRNSIFK